MGVSPCATWIILSGEWEETAENRALGLETDKAELSTCDEVWLCGDGISVGMRLEKEHAESLGIPVVECFTHDGEPPKVKDGP
jgi:hypothetical protein